MPKKAALKPEKKHFTVDEANRTLPLVRAIVADIVAKYAECKTLMERAGGTSDNGDLADRIAQIKDDLLGHVEELEELGIELKSYEMGLVDFHHLKDGRPVYLCWKLGEEKVSYWHDPEAGYGGRQPLNP